MRNLKLEICTLDRTPICDLYDSTPNRVRNIVEKLKINEITTLTFELPLANPKWLNLQNENLALFNGEYYKIKKVTFLHDDDNKLYASVECKHYSDNLANDLISIAEQTPLNVVDLMKVALCYDEEGNPTKGWTVGEVTVDRVAKRGLEAMEQSPFSILLTIAEKYQGILRFNSQTMTVDMLEAQGTERPTFDLRVSKNLKNFEISYDTSEIITRLYCYGATDDEGNELDIMSVNPTTKPYIDNFEYFKKIGYTDEYINAHPEIFINTNIWRDDNYYIAQDLYDDGVKELAKIAQPVVDVNVTALDMNVIGANGDIIQFNLGDCIRVLDEDIGVDTLCNIISREINYEEPHLLNFEVTNAVVYHDTLSKLFSDVNTVSSIVTSGGNIVGGVGGGTDMEEVKAYLNLYYLNAEQIDAKYANIDDLHANYITADEIKATYIDAETIAATYATIGSLHAIEAKIENLDVDYINGKLGEFDNLSADVAEFKKLIATDAEFEEIAADNVTIAGTLKAANAEIENLIATSVTTGEFNAYKATIENLFAQYASIEYLEANYIKAAQIEATYAKITDLDATNANITNLTADIANINTLIAGKADIKDLNAAVANIEVINGKLANIDTILAGTITTGDLEAEVARIEELIATNISAVNASITALDAKFATIEQLNTEIANVNQLIANKADIGDLNAAKADIGELDALVANINTILSGSIGTGILQTIHLTAQNMVVDDAVIKSAMIESLDVSKLVAGVISTNKFQVQSDDGGFKVIGNTTQWIDATGKVRMQAGRDAQGNFNFTVFGSDGTTAIFDENGIHEAAVPDGIIRDDMVADDANIQASKIQYVDTDGNKTLQTILDIQQGHIEALIKETTISAFDLPILDENGVLIFDEDIGAYVTEESVLDFTSNIYPKILESNVLGYSNTEDVSLKDKVLELVTTVDGLNLSISEVQSYAEYINSQMLEIKATADGVSTIVTSNKSAWDSAAENASNAISKVENLEDRANSGEFDGKGVQATEVTYQASTNGTTAPTGTWSNEIPSVPAGQYLWTKTVITYTDSTSTTMYSVVRSPEDGDKGDKGDTGNGVSSFIYYYLASPNATGVTIDTSGWTTTPQSMTATNKYLWSYQTINYTTGSPVNTTPSIIGVYGEGADGKGIKSVTPQYYLSTSNTTQIGGEWKDTQDEWSSGKYYWTRDVIVWTDDTTTYTTPTLATGLNNANSTAHSAQTIASQTAEKFTWIVKSGTSETNFELTDRTATLIADNINLNGLVTFTGLSSDVREQLEKIDNIEAGDNENLIPTYLFPTGTNIVPWVTGTALSRTLGQSDPYGGTDAILFTPTATNPQIKINKGGVLKQTGTHTFSVWFKGNKAGSINVYINTSTQDENKFMTFDIDTTWKRYTLTVDVNDLNLDFDVLIGGFSTWSDSSFALSMYYPKLVYGVGDSVLDLWIQDAVVNGQTTINGGYIKTQTITTDQLDVGEILAENGTFLGVINSQEINANRITSGLIKADLLNVYGLKVLQTETNVETLSIDSSGDIIMRGSVESYDFVSGTAGWSIKATGDAEFNDVTVRGDLIGNYGGIMSLKNFNAENGTKEVVFWAGTSYANRENAPFIVYSDGSVDSTQGNYSGLWTGNIKIGNISIIDPSSIAGNDATLSIQDGNTGVYRVRLTDSGSSSFAQNLFVLDNVGNHTLELTQAGGILATNDISVKSNLYETILTDKGININGTTLLGYDGFLKVNADSMDIGEVNNNSQLNVYGDIFTSGSLRLRKEINFNNVLVCSISENGIDFNLDSSGFIPVYFNSNGGSLVPTQYVNKGAKATEPADPTMVNATFGGWYSNEELTTLYDFDTAVNSELMLYAKWNRYPMQPQCSVVMPKRTSYVDEDGNDWRQGNMYTSDLVVNAVVSDGGKLSYKWDLDAYQEVGGQGTTTSFGSTITTNTVTAAQINDAGGKFMDANIYFKVTGICTVTNTLDGHTASTVVNIEFDSF